MKKRTDKEVAELLARAVSEIAATPTRSVCVTEGRARNKAARLFPTDNQEKLLQYIEEREFISFTESIGMDWRYLGGLFTRGLVIWSKHAGRYGLSPAKLGP